MNLGALAALGEVVGGDAQGGQGDDQAIRVALYELVPKSNSRADGLPGVGTMKYQTERQENGAAGNGELLTVYLRHKKPDAETATEREVSVRDSGKAWREASSDFRWAAAVALFGMELREIADRGNGGWALVDELARTSLGQDRFGYRAEFLQLLTKARAIRPSNAPVPPPAPEEQF